MASRIVGFWLNRAHEKIEAKGDSNKVIIPTLMGFKAFCDFILKKQANRLGLMQQRVRTSRDLYRKFLRWDTQSLWFPK